MHNTKDTKVRAKEGKKQNVAITLFHHHIVIRNRRALRSILYDLFISVWFIVGTVFFFYPSLKEAGICLFLIGSVQMFIRSIIRIASNMDRKE